jgi:hypothetical protein
MFLERTDGLYYYYYYYYIPKEIKFYRHRSDNMKTPQCAHSNSDFSIFERCTRKDIEYNESQ